jgi:hypothetical protein
VLRSWLGHDLGPPGFEAGPRHDAVLDGKEREQQRVHEERFGERHNSAVVDALRHAEIRNEADRAEHGEHGGAISGGAVEKRCEAGHG